MKLSKEWPIVWTPVRCPDRWPFGLVAEEATVSEDVEKKLKDALVKHVADEDLEGLLDETLDEVAEARVNGHLRICLICPRRLELLKEERSSIG